MILPIFAYGFPVLKKVAEEIDEDYPNLKQFISNMFETMDNSRGVGLAAPQVGKSVRIFVVDVSPFAEDEELANLGDPKELKGFRKVFINPIMEEESGKKWNFNEGCLSVPKIREDITRQENILISYYDENWKLKEEKYSGIIARVIQHEYDHLEGVLFTDKLNPLKKRLLKGKLNDISKGNISIDYKMKFPNLKPFKS